jgi:large subunit ribosomal protein L13
LIEAFESVCARITVGGPLKTYHAKPGEVEQEWLLVDATDIALGRLASQVASILRGKTKPQYTPHVDTGDFVVVVNAAKVKITGNKLEKNVKFHHTGFIGGLKKSPLSKRMSTRPDRVVEAAVRGMLPKNTLGRAMGKKLKVYSGPEHKHQAQNPRQITLEG